MNKGTRQMIVGLITFPVFIFIAAFNLWMIETKGTSFLRVTVLILTILICFWAIELIRKSVK
jgi:hypothetical protein